VPASAGPCMNSVDAVIWKLFGIDSQDRMMLTVCQPLKSVDPTRIATSSGLSASVTSMRKNLLHLSAKCGMIRLGKGIGPGRIEGYPR
jgi:hypothetical protein